MFWVLSPAEAASPLIQLTWEPFSHIPALVGFHLLPSGFRSWALSFLSESKVQSNFLLRIISTLHSIPDLWSQLLHHLWKWFPTLYFLCLKYLRWFCLFDCTLPNVESQTMKLAYDFLFSKTIWKRTYQEGDTWLKREQGLLGDKNRLERQRFWI